MPAETKTYTFAKGSIPEFEGKEITWERYNEPEAAIKAGHYDSMLTIMRYANAQLDIKRGHTAQRATKEKPRTDENGQVVGRDGSKLSLAEVEQIARAVTANASERTRDGISDKEAAKRYKTLQQKAREGKAELSPETLAELRAKGFLPNDVAPSAPASAPKVRK